MKIIIYLILSLFMSNMALAENTSNALTLPQSHFAILSTAVAPQLLQQCSRESPQVDSFWIPDNNQIFQLERQITGFIKQKKQQHFNTPVFQAYDRQYIGIIQNGEKLIYGNYFPSSHSTQIPPKQTEFVNVCDGIGSFWGVIYNPNTQQFSQLKINGVLDKPF